MRQILLLFTTFIASYAATAQQARVTKYTAPLSGSVVMSAIDDPYSAQVNSLEMPAPDATADKRRLRLAKEESAKRFPHKKSPAQHRKTTAAAAPVVSIAFVSDSLPGIPPDNDMAVSKSDTAIAVMNSRLALIDAKTGYIKKRISLKTFSSTAGLNGFNDYRYDPKVVYDPDADRYICVMLNSTDGLNYIVVGFSASNSPQGKWNFYKFYGDYRGDTTWFDYPAITITKDEFFFTGNKLRFNSSWQLGFKESVIYQINKNDGYSGATNLTYQIWDDIKYDGRSIRNLFPVKDGMTVKGPEQYFLSNRNFDVLNDTIFLVKIPDNIASGNNNLTVNALISPKAYGVPPHGRQPDTSVVLSTNDGRILGAYAQDDEIHFVSASVDTSNGASGVFHGRISAYKTNPAISHAHIFSIDTLDFGYPNISFAHNPWGKKHSIISFNYTGPNTFPGLAAIGFDGSDYSSLVKVKTGDSSIKVLGGKEQRWGDYTGSQIDYNNYGSVWIVGIYGRKDHEYGNWMARLNGSFVSVKDERTEKPQGVLYPNPAIHIMYFDFENPQAQELNFVIKDIQGRTVDNMLDQMCKKGKNRIQFNIASLTPGMYLLHVIDAKGAVVNTNRFTRK